MGHYSPKLWSGVTPARKGVPVEQNTNKPRDKTSTRLAKLLRTRGQGLVEYALILVMVAIVIIAILSFIGQQVFVNLYSKITSGMDR